MSWSARSRDLAGPSTRPVEAARQLQGELHSPGLEVALDTTSERESVRILDLGPAVAVNFDFLSGIGRYIRFVDLLGSGSRVLELRDQDGRARRRIAREILPPDWGTFDLVLAWDVINYLDDSQADPVVERLRGLCRDGAVLFAMIATSGEIPEEPPIYTIVDRSTVMCGGESTGTIACPRRPPAAVERLLSGFYVERSFILRHGVQEYVSIRH